MVGAKFEGAPEPAAGGEPVWTTLATITTRPSDEAWGSVESSDSTPYSCEYRCCTG